MDELVVHKNDPREEAMRIFAGVGMWLMVLLFGGVLAAALLAPFVLVLWSYDRMSEGGCAAVRGWTGGWNGLRSRMNRKSRDAGRTGRDARQLRARAEGSHWSDGVGGTHGDAVVPLGKSLDDIVAAEMSSGDLV